MHNLDSLKVLPIYCKLCNSKELNRRKDLGEDRGEGRKDRRRPCRT
jgi:hypothetical protein